MEGLAGVEQRMMSHGRLIVVDDEEYLALRAAECVKDQIAARRESVLALPTGRTPLKMYDYLVRTNERGEADFSRVTVFNLDELYGLSADHSASFASYLGVHFLQRVPVGRAILLDGLARDPDEECRHIEEEIGHAGGLDLAVLGIGRNGHIAFNEPGSPRDSRTRLVALTESSRHDNRDRFPSSEDVPYSALTMGVATILDARAILLMAAGPQKAGILGRALGGPVAADIPASYLQSHPNLTVIADRQAAAGLGR